MALSLAIKEYLDNHIIKHSTQWLRDIDNVRVFLTFLRVVLHQDFYRITKLTSKFSELESIARVAEDLNIESQLGELYKIFLGKNAMLRWQTWGPYNYGEANTYLITSLLDKVKHAAHAEHNSKSQNSKHKKKNSKPKKLSRNASMMNLMRGDKKVKKSKTGQQDLAADINELLTTLGFKKENETLRETVNNLIDKSKFIKSGPGLRLSPATCGNIVMGILGALMTAGVALGMHYLTPLLNSFVIAASPLLLPTIASLVLTLIFVVIIPFAIGSSVEEYYKSKEKHERDGLLVNIADNIRAYKDLRKRTNRRVNASSGNLLVESKDTGAESAGSFNAPHSSDKKKKVKRDDVKRSAKNKTPQPQ